ncbi:hypothetical protein ABH945_007145 [Paraburkholderia sp. GAS333]|uniref:hypothetical protein n=1 Tax=Paraburkholderia sp. GAS333 TaxID=3156279 RepID=UPI003D19A42B
MNDDQVNAEELEERKRRREAMQRATDDGMPVTAKIEERDAVDIAHRKPKQWIRHARKWLGAGGSVQSLAIGVQKRGHSPAGRLRNKGQ